MFTDYWIAKLNDLTCGRVDLPQVTALKAGLYTAVTGLATNAPTAEVAYTGYAKQTVTFGAGNVNDISVSFPNTDAQYVVSHVALIGTVGADTDKILAYVELATPKTVEIGDPFHVQIGNMNMDLLVSACP